MKKIFATICFFSMVISASGYGALVDWGCPCQKKNTGQTPPPPPPPPSFSK